MIPSFSAPTAIKLVVIRSALLLGVLLFGLVSWMSRRGDAIVAVPAGTSRALTFVFLSVAGLALVGLFAIRSRLQSLVEESHRQTAYIVGYALTESAAILGCCVWYLGGDVNWYVAGILVMVVGFQILPVRRG